MKARDLLLTLPGIRTAMGGWSRLSPLLRLGANPLSPLTIVEVGANNGSTFLPVARRMPRIKVLAFEPTPQLAENLRRLAHSVPNYIVIEAAVSEIDGSANFNVAGFGDWGCSSLLNFNETRGAKWHGRDDLHVSEIVPVKTVRLDTMIQDLNLREIDYLHVDAQGGDLQVLRSLGKYVDRVRCGVVEVPSSEDVSLYEGQHSEQDMLNFLAENGLSVVFQTMQQNEKNLYFRRTTDR